MAKPTDFETGQRVQTHPATDLWMMGDRYGVVRHIGRKRVVVKLDRSGRTVYLSPSDLLDASA